MHTVKKTNRKGYIIWKYFQCLSFLSPKSDHEPQLDKEDASRPTTSLNWIKRMHLSPTMSLNWIKRIHLSPHWILGTEQSGPNGTQNITVEEIQVTWNIDQEIILIDFYSQHPSSYDVKSADY